MREIKFRTWNKALNKMYNHSFLENIGYTIYGINNDDSLCFMQYTGLKDINGKEIYEGDIVKYENKLYEVSFKSCSFVIIDGAYAVVISQLIRSFPNNEINVVEIYGNIYENPELLEN